MKQSSMDSWKGMLEKTNTLVSHIPLDGIPVLQRDPRQLQYAGQSLFGDKTETQSNALRLLGQHNFDAEKLERELQQIVPKVPQQQHEEYEDEMHRIFATTIDESMDATTIASELKVSRSIHEDWAKERRVMLDELEHDQHWPQKENTDSNTMLIFVTPFAPHYMKEAPAMTTAPLSQTDSKMNIYMNILEQARAESNGEKVILQRFLSGCQEFLSEKQDVVQLWELVKCVVDDAKLGPQKFLEAQYRRFMTRQIESRSRAREGKDSLDVLTQVRTWLDIARRMPGLGKLSDSLNVYSQRENSLEEPLDTKSGMPLWAVAYYTMRSGAWNVCLKLLQDAIKQNRIPAMEHCIVTGLKQLLDSQFSSPIDANVYANITSLHDILQTGQRDLDSMATESNPWKRAIVQLMAADSADTVDASLNASIQDFLWFKLCVAASPNNSSYTNAHIAQVILSSGPDHFNGSKSPYLYSRILIMCGELEQALGFLAVASREGETEAVHLSIALKEHELIEIEETYDKDSTSKATNPLDHSLVVAGDRTKGESSLLNMGRLLHRYVSRFVHNNPKAAVLYFLELRPSYDTAEYLKKLILETMNLKDIIDGGSSSYTSDFMQHNGFLFQLIPDDKEPCFYIINAAAQKARASGRSLDAVRLYMRGGHSESLYDAVDLLSQHLVKVLRPPNDTRKEWKQIADMITARKEVMQSLSQDRIQAFEQLLELYTFFDMCAAKRWQNALECISWLLPERRSDVASCVSRYRHLDLNVRQAFPIVFEEALQVLCKLYAPTKQSGNTSRINQLKEQFQAYVEVFSSVPIQTAELAQLITSVEVNMV